MPVLQDEERFYEEEERKNRPYIGSGYMTFSEWARRVSDEYIKAEERACDSGDFSQANYWLTKRVQHELEVAKEKKNYRGL